ncbi:uncharacterized protein LOC132758011 [Ruditapes philippinarum]|uniref:uncharacterized protein LOC132758011 n=1 Tax=Ruditapes philippinarum TaxID=129788 RepID=UPI00295BE172|nr:uncharacterized protein LOC132758011 [Ruditapes philippinarum]XP_060605513.1 uncharacterized protein LOC132758011 [Ruditapes philippinarum]
MPPLQNLVALILSSIVLRFVSSVEVEFKAEYFSNFTLTCDDKLLALPYTTFKKYWILPNGSVIQWWHESGNNSRYFVGESPDFNLTITNVDEEDFGWYYCVILWDNYIYLVHTLKIGLNVNGALYKDLLDQYRKSAIIGLIAGGVTAALLSLFCLLYWCRYSEVNTKNDVKKEKAKVKTKSNKNDDSSSDSNSKANTDSTKENEAIYELDKAVKGYDDDGATVVGDGEIAVSIRKEEDDSEDGGRPIQIFEPVSGTTEISQPEVPRCSDDDGDCNNVIVPPPPPPPPLLHSLNDSFDEQDDLKAENAAQRLVFINHAYDAGNDQCHKSPSFDPDQKYVFEDDTRYPGKGHYDAVKF